MRNEDYTEFCDLLDGAYDLIGSGTNKVISGSAKSLFFAAMAGYSLPTVRAALSAHCLDKVRGRFTPKPADLIEQIEVSAANDGRPGAEEAWAIALTSRNELDTVVWTSETAEAFALCQPVLSMGDEVGARMAFKEAYTRIVAKARQAHKPISLMASLGWDQEKRVEVLRKASHAGLLPAPTAALLLEGPANDPTPDDKAKVQLEVIRKMMAESQAAKEQRLRDAEAKRLEGEAGFKPLSPGQVEAELRARR